MKTVTSYILLLLCLCSTSLSAQTFQNVIGTKENFEVTTCAATDADGNLLVGGYVYLTDSIIYSPLLVKFNSDGSVDSKFTIPELNNNYFANIAGIQALRNADGEANGYIIVFNYRLDVVVARFNKYSKAVWAKIIHSVKPGGGNVIQATYSPDTKMLNGFYLSVQEGLKDILIKLSIDDGAIRWQKHISYPNNDYPFLTRDILADDDGGCLVAGDLELETTKPVIIKFSPGGRLLWGKGYNFIDSKNGAIFTSIAATRGGYVLSGVEYKDNYVPNLTMKINKKGDVLWANNYSIRYLGNAPHKLITDDIGNILFAGPNSYQPSDINHKAYMVKLDSMGNVIFGKKYENKAILNDIKLAPGGYYATGHTDFENNYHPSDLYIIKTDTAGNIDGSCNATSVLNFKKTATEYKKSSSTEYSITDDTLTVHDITLTTQKLGFVRQDRCGTEAAAITEKKELNSTNNLSVSPNPSHGTITVTYNSTITSRVQLNVYDKTGKLMFTKPEQAIKGKNTYQLNLLNLINGIYNLQLNNGMEQSQAKLVIER